MFDDAVGLLHLFHAHQVTVVAVTRLTHRDVKVHAVIDLIRLLLAQVPGNTRAAQHGTRKAEVHGTLWRDNANAHSALLPDAVVGEQRVVFVQIAVKAVRKVVNEIQQRAIAVDVELLDGARVAHFIGLVLGHRLWQVAVDAAGAEIGRVHARATGGFVHVKQVFALAKRIHQQRHRPAIQRMGTDP